MKRPAAAALALALALPAAAQEPERQDPFPYNRQGPFVVVPAKIVSAPVSQIGYMTGAFLCLPWSIAKDSRGEGEQSKQPSRICGNAAATGLGWPVYAAAGLPFFILKQLFWDAPRAVGRAARGGPPDK